MSKNGTSAVQYGHVTPEMVVMVKDIIADSVKHEYSARKVYPVYNAVFQKNDKPQTCGSCMERRVRELKKWLAEYEQALLTEQTVDVETPSYELADSGDVITIDANGKATRQNGKGLSNGRYETKDGGFIVVSGGSKARYEEDLI